MEGYRDLHLALSAGHYTSRYPAGYGVDRRASYDPLYAVYPRAAVDPYGGYGAAYQAPEYSYVMSPRRRPIAKRRPTVQANGRQRPAPPQSLTPRKKPFKKTQKGFQGADAKPQRKAPQVATAKPQKAGGSTLAKETEDLHKLFRTGVDSGIKIVKPKEAANGVGKKRKADVKKGSPVKKKGMAKNKKFGKGKKKEVKKDEKAVEAAKAPLTEEEKQEMEIALELQKTACKAFAEFFEIPVKIIKPELEAVKDELAEADDGAEKTEAAAEEDKTEEAVKASPKPKLTPEMAKEIELKALNFFSKVLAENDELSKLYLNKKDAGTFECLVCHSINPETSKRFNNVTGLVSHTIMRRQRRPEHRGFGKAICEIFGWEALRPNKPIKQVTAAEEIVKDVLMEKAEEENAEKQETTEDE